MRKTPIIYVSEKTSKNLEVSIELKSDQLNCQSLTAEVGLKTMYFWQASTTLKNNHTSHDYYIQVHLAH